MSPDPGQGIALVTGAGRGLGRVLAIALARAGFDIALLARSVESLRPVEAEIKALGRRAVGVEADVTDAAAVEAGVLGVHGALGPIDVLINNAGVIESTEVPVWQEDPAEFRRVVETDLIGPFHLIRAVVPAMVARGGGRVITMSSNAGTQDRAAYAGYSAAKAGLFRLSGSLHLAGREHGLKTFEISPGHIRTDMTLAMAIHAGRTDWVEPAQLADLVVAAACGDLDDWSGAFLVAGLDTPASLAGAAPERVDGARQLSMRPYGPGDPYRG